MSKHISSFLRGEIIGMMKSGLSTREISEKTKVPRTTIGNICRKYTQIGHVNRLEGSGRPKTLNYQERAKILKIHKQEPKICAPKIQKRWWILAVLECLPAQFRDT